jgi:hypothetical protein
MWRESGALPLALPSDLQHLKTGIPYGHLVSNSHTKTGLGSTALIALCALVLCGCSTLNYGLRPAPASIQSSSTIGDTEYINASASLAHLSVAAEVDDFFKSKYIVVVLLISNTSSTTLDVGYNSFDVRYCNVNSERGMSPIEPDALIAKFSKERRSGESGRGWATFFQALAAAHHDPGENIDYGKVSQTVSSGTAANQSQTQDETRMIRTLDMFLIRRGKVPPGGKGVALVFFPFSQAESYKIRIRIGKEAHEFLFRLRTY